MIYVMSGGAKAFAVIGVTYPEGSTCTCTDGTKTLKLKDTSGQGIFLIPYAAIWTVTATDGTNTKSESVEITTEGQSENIVLNYQLVLFDGSNGGDNNEVTGGWATSATDSSNGGNTSEVTTTYLLAKNGGGAGYGDWYGGTSYVSTKKTIDVSAYSTCTFIVTETQMSPKFSVGGAVKTVSSTGTHNLDISSVKGAVAVQMTATRPQETWNAAALKVTKILLK